MFHAYQLDAIHASNADQMQVHGDTRPACDGAVQYLGMIPGGGYSEIFGHCCCTILGYAKPGGIAGHTIDVVVEAAAVNWLMCAGGADPAV